MDALLDALGFNWKILLANVVNFLILLFLLSKIGLKPMRKFIEKRQQEIQEGIDNAQKASKALENAQEESRALISQAQKTYCSSTATQYATGTAFSSALPLRGLWAQGFTH